MEDFKRPTPPPSHRPRVIAKHVIPSQPFKSPMDLYAERLKQKAAEEAARPKPTPEEIAEREAEFRRRMRERDAKELAAFRLLFNDPKTVLRCANTAMIFRFESKGDQTGVLRHVFKDADAKAVAGLFLAENALHWASKCVFEPGGRIVFDSPLGGCEIVVCFKCDDVCAIMNGKENYFGMGKDLRQSLVELFKVTMPDDEAIQAIQ